MCQETIYCIRQPSEAGFNGGHVDNQVSEAGLYAFQCGSYSSQLPLQHVESPLLDVKEGLVHVPPAGPSLPSSMAHGFLPYLCRLVVSHLRPHHLFLLLPPPAAFSSWEKLGRLMLLLLLLLSSSIMEPEFCFESRNNSCLKIVHPLPLRVVLYIFFVLLIILTVCGNLLVTVSVSYFKQLHTPTNFLIVSLAVSDLLVGVIIMFPRMIHFLESCWYFGDFLCKVSLSSNVMFITASIINLCFISIDRYYAVCQPLLYRSRITDNTVLVMIVVSWGVSVFIGFGMVFFQLSVLGSEEFYNKNVACEGGCFLFQTKLSSTLSSFLSFYLPGVILLGVYLKILLVAQKQFRSIQRAGCVSSVKPSNTSQTKATKTLAIVLGAFLSFWTPFFVIIIIDPFIGYSVPPEVFETVLWLGLLNSALNPIIYAFFYSWFRKAFHLLISGNMFKSDISETTLFSE
ncbi:trace amine-associated receptor 1-like [Halichoeres trimaculatus]|uniref:trace amine-associated receptor 1-like n=1 Tax=Halichoeres trimaculatus TaxID=147232 RepID=UPI003D9E9C1D